MCNLVDRWGIDTTNWSNSEAKAYEQGASDLRKFKNVLDLTLNLKQFTDETHVLFVELSQETVVPAVASRREVKVLINSIDI